MFIVLELQSSGADVAYLVSKHTTLAEAESKFHQVLAAAAVSSVYKHSAVLMDDTGKQLKVESYMHEIPEEEPKEENENL